MKNSNLILVILLVATGFASCKKVLDVEPKQSIDAVTALQNDQDVNSLVVGCYSRMGGGSLYGTNLLMQADLLAIETVGSWRGTFQGSRQVANKTMTRDNTEANLIWTNAYNAINMANIVLANLGVVKDADLKKQLEGEALFVRGIMHFELVRFFALPWGATADNTHLGVVIKSKPTNTELDAFEKLPRNTVKQVYDAIIADLTKATGLMPEENEKRATKYAAFGFLSRVYLAQGDFAKARDAANEVIESGYFKLNASVSAVFSNKNTAESVWEIEQNEQNNAGTANNGMATFYASLPGIGRADVRIAGAFIDEYHDDLRGSEWYYVGTGARPGNLYTSKWKSFSQNLPIIRLAEMYLTRAEGNKAAGTEVGATPAEDMEMIINAVRTNSSAPIDPTLDEIRDERFRELAFEGQRIHDIRRLRKPTGEFAWNSPKLVMPIPQREIDATTGIIVQNPGY
jgi:hypothetical protein